MSDAEWVVGPFDQSAKVRITLITMEPGSSQGDVMTKRRSSTEEEAGTGAVVLPFPRRRLDGSDASVNTDWAGLSRSEAFAVMLEALGVVTP